MREFYFGGHLGNRTVGKSLKTSIHITEAATASYKRMSARYSAKLAVSAGVLLLDRLKAEDRERIIDEVNGVSEKDAESRRQARVDEDGVAKRAKARSRKTRQRRNAGVG